MKAKKILDTKKRETRKKGHASARTSTHTHTHMHTHTHTHTHTHRHRNRHRHTHTYTHTRDEKSTYVSNAKYPQVQAKKISAWGQAANMLSLSPV